MSDEKRNDKERLLFECSGLPKKIKTIYRIGCGLLLAGSAAGLAAGCQMKQMAAICICAGILAVGLLFLRLLIVGRKIDLKIFEAHLEGYEGYGFFPRKVSIPFGDISELSSDTRGFLCSLIIYTEEREPVSFYMDRRKVDQAEHIVRNRWNYILYNKG